jgi:DNA-directed RNA polymerase subunit M/transcription elongation factor TFIIS
MDTKDIYHCDETRQFVKHTCPYCGSEETWQWDEQNDGDYIETFHKCDSCEKEWTNV